MNKFGLILFLFFCSYLNAQKHDYYWVMGSRWGEDGQIVGSDLQFRENTITSPVFTSRNYTIHSSISAISDHHGNFLFATNMCNIFDRFNNPIFEGDQLYGHELKVLLCDSSAFYGHKGTQLSFFLPHPFVSELYVLLHLSVDHDAVLREDFSTQLFTTILDARTNSIVKINQQLIEAKMTAGLLTAVRHADGKGWWILIPEHKSDTYLSLLLDETGVFHGPFKQQIGPVNHHHVWTGSAAFSPDGTRYARIDEFNNLQVMRFDRCTGRLSDYKNLFIPYYNRGSISLAFSPNGQYLYFSEPFDIFQVDLQAEGDLEDHLLHISKIDVNPDSPAFPTTFGKMQLGPDHKIYITNWSCPWIHTIHQPDSMGQACNLEQHAIKMKSPLSNSMPYMPNYRLGPTSCDDACCNEVDAGNFVVTPNPGDGIYRIKGAEAQMDRYKLFDLSGKLLLENRFLPCLQSELDISHLPSGAYLLYIYGPDTFATKKLLKM